MSRAVLWSALVVAGSVGLARWLGQGPRVVRGKTRLLVIGDSMAEALTPHLAALAKENAVPMRAIFKRGSTIQHWAARQDVDRAILEHKPDLVLVVLGTNDAFLTPASLKAEQPALELLMRRLTAGGASVAWVGPPQVPRADNGVVDFIKGHVRSSDYFDSRSCIVPRGPDQLHPTARGAAGWAGAVWRWMS